VALVFECPSCRAKYSVPEELVGRKVRCRKCGGVASVQAPRGKTPAEKRRTADKPPGPATKATAEAVSDEPIELDLQREAIDSEMDMTPMVDVTFLLLIFFMVTAAFSLQKSIEIPKPKQDEASTQAQQQDPEEDPEYVTVFVDEFNTYHVITIDWDVEAPSQQELLRKLKEARDGNSAGRIPTKLLVKAHGEALHEKVVAALDAGTEVGMEQVQLVTVEESE
jgi:biopolymer transport protein ExbD